MKKNLLYGVFGGLLLGGFSIYFYDYSDAPKSDSILLHAIGEKARFVTTANQNLEIIGDNVARRESEQIKNFPNPNNNSTDEDNSINMLDVLFDQNISDKTLRKSIKASINKFFRNKIMDKL